MNELAFLAAFICYFKYLRTGFRTRTASLGARLATWKKHTFIG